MNNEVIIILVWTLSVPVSIWIFAKAMEILANLRERKLRKGYRRRI